MSLLFVSANLHGFKTGAAMVSNRNHDCLKSIVRDNEFYSYSLSIFNTKSLNPLYYLKKIYNLINLYTNGLSAKELENITTLIRNKQITNVFLDSSLLGLAAQKIKREFGDKVHIVTFFHNIETDLLRQEMEKKASLKLRARPVYQNELLTCRYSDKLLVLNARDKALLNKYYGQHDCVIVPITINDAMQNSSIAQSDDSEALKLLFVGSSFFANINGISWFVKNVMPHLNASLVIAGRGMENYKADFESSNIEVLGAVDDLSLLYSDAHAVVAPIFEGGGMKVKIAEALMHGKFIFGTGEAFTGYDIDFGTVAALCHSANDFIDEILKYSNHSHLGDLKFNRFARDCFQQNYSNDKAVQIFKEIF